MWGVIVEKSCEVVFCAYDLFGLFVTDSDAAILKSWVFVIGFLWFFCLEKRRICEFVCRFFL